jgi:hypothetical protein
MPGLICAKYVIGLTIGVTPHSETVAGPLRYGSYLLESGENAGHR